ncbi:MAG: purine-nucleoside phosphorylase [Bacteroidia bacterium]
MLETIRSTADFLKKQITNTPTIGIVMGTGLGNLSNEMEVEKSISYKDIPNFPVSTVEGHSGNLIFGKLGGKNVVAMQGRFHFYEGYSMQEVVFPIRVMKLLGVETLFVSNAAGGVNPEFEVGDLMIINDHINLFPTNPLIGKNISELGTRFPDMSQAYSKELIERAFSIAEKHGISLKKGVYAGLSGPTLETPAEYKYVRIIGADAVGMSTVPEVIVGVHMNMTCFAFSIITDIGVEGRIEETTHEMVQQVAQEQEPKMRKIVTELIAST